MKQLNISELRALPKIELHRHLDCSMRWSTMQELSKTLKLNLPDSPAELKKALLITEPMRDLESVLKKFLYAQKLLASEEILERLAFECCEDAYQEGIRIIELRYAPTFIQSGHPSLSFQKIHEAFLRGLKKAEQSFPIATGLICILQRIYEPKECEPILNFAIDNKDTFIAVDLADNEEANPSKKFSPLFAKAKQAGLAITIHSGETPHPSAPQWVKDSIEQLYATRIGHGVQIINNPSIIEFVKKNNITLEVCPISNYLTQAFPTYADHPFKKLDQSGVKLTINSDDPGIFSTTLSEDYGILNRYFGYDERDFARLNANAFAASFIDEKKKRTVYDL